MAAWYGGKDEYLSAVKNPVGKEVAKSYQRRIDELLERMIGKRDCPADSMEVKKIVGEYGFVMRQFCQVKDERGLMLAVAKSYRNDPIKSKLNEKYGEGAAEFLTKAIEKFYTL